MSGRAASRKSVASCATDMFTRSSHHWANSEGLPQVPSQVERRRTGPGFAGESDWPQGMRWYTLNGAQPESSWNARVAKLWGAGPRKEEQEGKGGEEKEEEEEKRKRRRRT